MKLSKERRKFIIEALGDLMWYSAGMVVFGPRLTVYIWAASVVVYLGASYFLTAEA